VLIEEIDEVKKKGYFKEDSQLMISEQTHLILPYHRRIDVAREKTSRLAPQEGG